ncbi:MAG: hypothetical protein RLZZ471_700 [Actinomycetota bacterium]|jgi:hypothetical protein
MKKLIALAFAFLLTLTGAMPSSADITYLDNWPGWGYPLNSSISLSVSGSIKAGEPYTVNLSGSCPQNDPSPLASARIVDSTNTFGAVAGATGITALPLSSGEFLSGAPGTTRTFVGTIDCGIGLLPRAYRTQAMTITFETPITVGAPTNFVVTPQAGGSVFATWGVASEANSYTIQTAPGGATCTTSQNYCTISGLTDGTTYTFNLTASNGNKSSTIGSGPVLYREPIDVKASVDSPNWKVGETVTANYTVHGSPPYTTTVTWYRCDRIVPPTQVAPVECTTIRSGASNTYTLVSADLGKYITAYVSSTNGTSTQGQTAPGSVGVLAANALAPTPSPDGKPTIVAIPNATVPVAGGTQIIIAGTGLAGVTSVTIGGVLAEIVSKTDTAITVKVPTSNQPGAADVVVTNDKGSATKTSAVVYTSTQTPSPTPTGSPATPVVPVSGPAAKTLSLANFAATQVNLTAAQKSAVKKLVTANPTLTKLVCTAKSTGPKLTARDLAAAEARAAATCSYAASLRSNLYVNATGTAGISKATSRNVTLTLKN